MSVSYFTGAHEREDSLVAYYSKLNFQLDAYYLKRNFQLDAFFCPQLMSDLLLCLLNLL